MNLYFLENYNNYFNRTIKPLKQYQTIQDFEFSEVFKGNAKYITGVNFNFADYVDTTQILNWHESWMPDYMLLVDDNGSIDSSWFVIDSKYQRNGQLSVQLKRDVINDYYDKIIESPMYIEKATINDINDPLLYNSEGVVFNQIKQKETQLFDETGCGWIVGYVAKPQENEKDIDVNASVNLNFDYTANSLPFERNTTVYDRQSPWQLNLAMGYAISGALGYTSSYRSYIFYGDNLETVGPVNYISVENSLSPYLVFPDKIEEFDATLLENLDAWKQNIISTYPDIDALSYNGKIVFDTEEDKYYRIQVINEGIVQNAIGYMRDNTNAGTVALKHAIDTTYKGLKGGVYIGTASCTATKYTVKFIELPNANMTSKISASRLGLTDAPYDMFAIPYGRIMIAQTTTSQTPIGITNAEAALNIARDIVREGTTLKVYDMQLLPYCPCPEYMAYNNVLALENWQENIHYNLVSTKQTIESVILWCSASSRTFTIDYNYFIKEPKIENECDMWRIVSPNYQGMFDFSAAKNGGINGFTVDYTYKPYNPYIHIAPVWGNLYGFNFGDTRGLICGGDFSLPQTSDAFKQYEITNKNYQNIFDRGIQNLEYNRKFQRANEIASAFTGSVGTSTVGFMAGGAAGAVVGGVLGLGAGIADAAMSEAMYKENKNYQTDLYNYNLGNIKAQPDSLTKSSALTINHKIVPVLEYYSCTDKEKEALRNKLKYNGMTVMAIGQLKDYLLPEETFVQGQIIRIDAAEDAHTANIIYNELKKGIFTTAANFNSEE